MNHPHNNHNVNPNFHLFRQYFSRYSKSMPLPVCTNGPPTPTSLYVLTFPPAMVWKSAEKTIVYSKKQSPLKPAPLPWRRQSTCPKNVLFSVV